jgi:DNA-binding NarL/FixJ family response regulator
MIRVLVLASSAITRSGLEGLIRASPLLALMDSPTRGGPAGKMVSHSEPDVVIAEGGPNEENRRELLDWVATGIPVVLIAEDATAQVTADALRAGVKAVLSTDASGPELIAAIEAAAAGLIALRRDDLAALLPARSHVPESASGTLLEPLTPREIEVLRLLADGLGNKEIAARLAISEHTAKFHVGSIMGKLGATSRTEAVMLGIRHGLIMI